MSFVDDIKRHLERVGRDAVDASFALDSVEVDGPFWRQRLVALLARAEREVSASPDTIRLDHYHWTDGDRVVRFVRQLALRLRAGMARNADESQLQTMIDYALAGQLGLPDRLPSLAEQLELESHSQAARRVVLSNRDDHWEDVPRYAREIGATARAPDGGLRMTSAGRVLLDITGRDSVRWLLHLEAARSTGPEDPWRMSAETAARLCANPECVLAEEQWHSEPGDTDPDSRWATIRRLDRLGVLSYVDSTGEPGGAFGYHVHPTGLGLLREIADGSETPFRVLATTLLQDQTNRTLVDAQPALAATFRESMASAGARQARMVAHEVRNALVPVQVALEGLYRDVPQPEAHAVLSRYRARIDGGIDRTFRFVDEQLKTLSLAEEPPSPFDAGTALAEALAAMNGEIELVLARPSAGMPPVRGHRTRFIRAIVNVLRNSVQAMNGGRPRIRLQATVQNEDRDLVITIEDNGPGIPADYREAVFSEGFSLRPGGSRVGLALARAVLQDEMRGRISVIDAPLGGAGFLITLPLSKNGHKELP